LADPPGTVGGAPVAGRVTVAVVNYNCGEYIDRTLASLRQQTWADVEVVVADNGSTDDSPRLIAERFPEARLLPLGHNAGFADGTNRAAEAGSGEYVFMLNPDAWLEPDTIGRLVDVLRENPDIGVVGGTVLHEDGSVQETGNRLDRFGFPVPRRQGAALPLDRDVFYVGGCSLMMRQRDWDRLGGLDGRMFMFFEEVDLCWRAQRSGLDIAVAPEAVIWHIGGATLAGGYAKEQGRHQTSPSRVYLRERNTLASVLRNGDASTLAWAGLGWALNVVEALGFLALRQPRVAAQYPRALWWNIRRLPGTLRRRRATRPTFTRRDRDLRGWARGSGKVRVLRSGGVPSVKDA
jgi:GT2 family glycosyltransferase